MTESDVAILDLAQVRGQEVAKRALEVAAAGGHNLLLAGPSGSGKTMLARRLPGLLPPLTLEESVEVARIHALAAIAPPAGLWQRRPFRSPPNGIRTVDLIGGGSPPRPGEVSLAHQGVLFLDDLTGFRRAALAALCRPLAEGMVADERARTSWRLPARFSLLATLGIRLGDPGGQQPRSGERHRGRMPAPLLERLDLYVEVPAVSLAELRSGAGETTAAVAARVAAAREIQRRRFGTACPTPLNAFMEPEATHRHCPLAATGRSLLERACERLGLGARDLVHILKVARTLADLAGVETIQPVHLAEAIQFRSLADRP